MQSQYAAEGQIVRFYCVAVRNTKSAGKRHAFISIFQALLILEGKLYNSGNQGVNVAPY